MTFEKAIKSFFAKYADFKGRSKRSEFWWPVLFNFIVGAVLGALATVLGLKIFEYISAVYGLLVLIPSLAVAVRRLHDIGKSGWYLLIGLIPIVGWIILLIWFVTK